MMVLKKKKIQNLFFWNHPQYLLTQDFFAHEILCLEHSPLPLVPTSFVLLRSSCKAGPSSEHLPKPCLPLLLPRGVSGPLLYILLAVRALAKQIRQYECKYPARIRDGLIEVCFPLDQGFSTSTLLTFWSGQVLVQGCPVPWRVLSTTVGSAH